jgi:hypothetical protein
MRLPVGYYKFFVQLFSIQSLYEQFLAKSTQTRAKKLGAKEQQRDIITIIQLKRRAFLRSAAPCRSLFFYYDP